MALATADRVKETSTTTGTGTYSLAGAATGYQTFVAGIGTGNTCYYCATDGTDWEIGLGTVTDATPDTLARTTFLASSTGSAISWTAGTRTLFCIPPAARTKIAGKETIWIPAGAMRPTVSNGCAPLVDVETTAGRPDMQVLDFDATADEHAQFQVAFPKSWDLGTVTFQAFWSTSGAVTTGVAIGLQGVAVSDNETMDVAYGTAVVVTDDAQSAAEELYVTAESGAVTIAGTPAAGDVCFFRVFRDVSDANDDMTQDMRLVGLKLHFTTNAPNDE